MREWLVAGAVIEGPEGVLLVRNRRRDGSLDWSPPGGVIDEGETVEAGLTREVQEETGLVVSAWQGPLYEVEATAPALGWHLRVEVHQALSYRGALHVDDPDGIVVDARFVAVGSCPEHLADGHPWVVEPLTAWLLERWADGTPRGFRYEVAGRHRSQLVVTRL